MLLWIRLTLALFRYDVQVTLPVPANPVILKKAAAAQAAKEQKEAKEAKAKEKAAAAAGDETQKEEKPKEEKPKPEEKPKEETPKEEDEEEKPKEPSLPASWLKPVKWFMGQFAKENGKLSLKKLPVSRLQFGEK